MRASIAVALLAAAVSAYGQGGGLPDRTPPPRLQWQRIRAYDGKFSFAVPGTPAYKTQTLTAKNGQPVRYTTYTVDLGRTAYMASTSDYDSKTRVSLDGAIDGVLSSSSLFGSTFAVGASFITPRPPSRTIESTPCCCAKRFTCTKRIRFSTFGGSAPKRSRISLRMSSRRWSVEADAIFL